MKDIIISKQIQKRELKIFLVCLILAEIINAFAIILYKTHWYELFTYLGYVTCIALFFYLITLFVRLVYLFVKRLIKKRK